MFVDSPVATVINRQEKLLLTEQLSTTFLVVNLRGWFLGAHLAEWMLNQILNAHLLVFLQQLSHLRAALPDRFLAQLLLGRLLLRTSRVQPLAELCPQSWSGFLLVASEGHWIDGKPSSLAHLSTPGLVPWQKERNAFSVMPKIYPGLSLALPPLEEIRRLRRSPAAESPPST